MSPSERQRIVDAFARVGETLGRAVVAYQEESDRQRSPVPQVPKPVVIEPVKVDRPTENASDEPPRLYSRDEAAKWLGVSVRTVDCWTRTGQLKVVKLGRAVKIRREELERVSREGIE